MHEVEIIFSTPHKFSLISSIVRFIYKTEFSHVAIKFKQPQLNKDLVFEAYDNGVQLSTFEKWSIKNKVIDSFSFQMDNQKLKSIHSYCLDNMGVKYGYLTLIGILLKGKFGIGKDSNRTLICSEFVQMNMSDFISHQHVETDYITPKDLYLVLKEDKGEGHK